MNLLEIESGLINGTLILDSKGHCTNSVIDHITMSLDGEKKWIKELEKGSYIDRDKKVWDKEKCNRMLTYLTSKLERDYEIGEFIHETEHYCFDCGKTLHIILTSENTISLIDFGEYDDLRKASGIDWRSFEFRVNPADIKDCSCKPLRDAGKMVSEINVSTGELLFTNFFKQDNIYEFPKDVNSYDSESAS